MHAPPALAAAVVLLLVCSLPPDSAQTPEPDGAGVPALPVFTDAFSTWYPFLAGHGNLQIHPGEARTGGFA